MSLLVLTSSLNVTTSFGALDYFVRAQCLVALAKKSLLVGIVCLLNQCTQGARIPHLSIVDLAIPVAVVFKGQRVSDIDSVNQADAHKVVESYQQLGQRLQRIVPHMWCPLPDEVAHGEGES